MEHTQCTKKDWKYFWKLSVYWNEEEYSLAYMVKLIETQEIFQENIQMPWKTIN